MNPHPRLAELTGLRGIAALLVVFSHLSSVSFTTEKALHLGELGVMVFFSLSGFLMAMLYLGRPFSAGGASDYAIARFARIAPAYLSVVVAAYLIRTTLDPAFIYALDGHNIARHLLFTGSEAVFWSIPPEVQFYFFFVFLWFTVDAWLRRRQIAWILAAAIVCLVVILNRRSFGGTLVGSSLHFFLFGVIAGFLRARTTRWPFSGRSLWIMQLLLLLIPALVLGFTDFGLESNQQVYASLLNAAFAALLVLTYSFPTAWSSTTLGQPGLQLCGECSFSIYLLHEPLIYWTRPLLSVTGPFLFTVLVLVVIVGCSYANFRLIERLGGRYLRQQLTRLASLTRLRVGTAA